MLEHTNLLKRIAFYEAVLTDYRSVQQLMIPDWKESKLYKQMENHLFGWPWSPPRIEITSLEMFLSLWASEVKRSKGNEYFALAYKLALKNDTRVIICLEQAKLQLEEMKKLPTFSIWFLNAGYEDHQDDDCSHHESRWSKDTCKPGDFASEKEYLKWAQEQDYDEVLSVMGDTQYQKKLADEKRHRMERMCQQIMSKYKIKQVDSEEFFTKVQELCEHEQGKYESELGGIEEDGLCGGFGMTRDQFIEDRNFVRERMYSNREGWNDLSEYLNETFPIFAAMMRQRQVVEV